MYSVVVDSLSFALVRHYKVDAVKRAKKCTEMFKRCVIFFTVVLQLFVRGGPVRRRELRSDDTALEMAQK